MEIGARMKGYEMQATSSTLLPRLPFIARLDGRAFHSYTSKMERPFDGRLTAAFDATTAELVKQTHAVVGYTQSDEISLVFEPARLYDTTGDTQTMFNGRLSKLNSVLASMCTAIFNREVEGRFVLTPGLAYFDCRTFNVPDRTEAVNCLIWRQQDAIRNSILMAGYAHYSHQELFGKKTDAVKAMLEERGINWAHYPLRQRHGQFIRRNKVTTGFLPKDLEALPEKHNARKNLDLVVTRTQVGPILDRPLANIKNRVEVVFDGAEPVLFEEVNVPAPAEKTCFPLAIAVR